MCGVEEEEEIFLGLLTFRDLTYVFETHFKEEWVFTDQTIYNLPSPPIGSRFLCCFLQHFYFILKIVYSDPVINLKKKMSEIPPPNYRNYFNFLAFPYSHCL